MTYTGRQFWPLDPRAEDIDIRDVAHHLSLICRFNGAGRAFYSLAQHSCLVADTLDAPLKLWGLLHDAAEAYDSRKGDLFGLIGSLESKRALIDSAGGVP